MGALSLAGRAARLRRPALLLQSRVPDTPHFDLSGRIRTGYLHYEAERLVALCRDAQAHGFQLAVHAACNAGIDQVLNAYERMDGGRYRNRVEHLVSLDNVQARRLSDVGAVGVVQPSYIREIGDEWEATATPSRLKSVPLRSLLDAGVQLAGSSDGPVVDYDPLRGMEAAITRRTANGLIHQGDQSITAREALHLWTSGSALAANLIGEVGVLRPGARADVAVLSRNPLTTHSDMLHTISVERTILGGRTVFAIPGSDESNQGRAVGAGRR